MSLSESIAFKRANYYLIFGIIVVFFEFNDFQIPYTPPSPPVHTHTHTHTPITSTDNVIS